MGEARKRRGYLVTLAIDEQEPFREFARLTGADTVAYDSRCGHMTPVCETEGIGWHVGAHLDAAPRASASR